MTAGFRPSHRRDFLTSLATAAAALTLRPSRLFSKDAEQKPSTGESGPRRETFTYKKVDNLEIKADVYHPPDDRGDKHALRPILFWIHGGALITGDRNSIDRRLKLAFLKDGYVLVSIDYRLAPETKLPAIIDDLRDAYSWVHEQGPRHFAADTRRIAVAGGSAGGYLTLMSGFSVKPRPAVLISLWGYGDIAGDWYIKPSAHYRKQPLVTKENAWKSVSGPPVTDRQKSNRGAGAFYLYCRQQGLWTNLVSGFDPRTEDAALTPYCPARNVTKDYPPTILIHGTRDTDVPYEQSVQMDKELTRAGVEHRLILVPNAGHGLPGGDPKQVGAAYAAALDFANRHVKT